GVTLVTFRPSGASRTLGTRGTGVALHPSGAGRARGTGGTCVTFRPSGASLALRARRPGGPDLRQQIPIRIAGRRQALITPRLTRTEIAGAICIVHRLVVVILGCHIKETLPHQPLRPGRARGP